MTGKILEGTEIEACGHKFDLKLYLGFIPAKVCELLME